jgi:hypothetical protein
MLWVVQNNLYNEAGYVRFIEALDRFSSNYIVVKPVPFFDLLLPEDFDSAIMNVEDTKEVEIDASQPIVVMGAHYLSKIAKQRNWLPGTFHNDNFDFNVWSEGYGRHNILNHDAIVGKLSNIVNTLESDDVFARPLHDTKTFAGNLMTREAFEAWRDKVRSYPYQDEQKINMNLEIIIASPKVIYAEYRFFIVRSNIVTHSLYRRGGKLISDENVDNRVVRFVTQMIQTWEPSVAYVLDVAETPDGFKVVEINTFNSSGFYACDVQKIVISIEDLVKHYSLEYMAKYKSRGILI